MSPDTPTDVRRRLLALVKDYPGLHLREAARQLSTSLALVEYHVDALRRDGLVATENDQRFVRIHPAKGGTATLSAQERRALHALRARQGLLLVLFLLDQDGPALHGEIAVGLAMGKSTVSFHLRKLEAARLVRKQEDGRYELQDRAATAELLRRHRPTPDMRRRFASLWGAFYDH